MKTALQKTTTDDPSVDSETGGAYSKVFNTSKYDLKTVSGRMNALLDFADEYAPPDDGRSRQLAEEFNCSKSGAKNWVLKNSLPTRKQLHQIVETQLLKISGNFHPAAVVAWIEHGDAVTCPFV
ncbi:MAG: hypothetical protein V3T17_14270 [Pseudomonadales bacterium]